jgi:hypothetical protein
MDRVFNYIVVGIDLDMHAFIYLSYINNHLIKEVFSAYNLLILMEVIATTRWMGIIWFF